MNITEQGIQANFHQILILKIDRSLNSLIIKLYFNWNEKCNLYTMLIGKSTIWYT